MDGIIVFDNLRQSNSEIVGQTQPVKAVWPVKECFSQPNAMGVLYQPKNLNDVSIRACEAGARFRAMFQQPSATI
ncbi:MAG: hypothetical protein V1749_11545 [Candidatus Desantisbacteria bacterium]